MLFRSAHLGNARSAVNFDMLHRLLRHDFGVANVAFVRNITDVDDKIIARALETGVSIADLTAASTQDYLDDLEFEGDSWLEGHTSIPVRPELWDSRKLSVGAPPIKTDEGWLVIYHAVDDRDDTRYKIGAMILDLKDPAKVLWRTKYPMLEPNMWYEND